MVFQGYTLFPWLNVRSNVMFGLKMQGMEEITAKAEARQWLDMVGLEKFENLYPHELSGGMKQRVAIARALVTRPSLVLADEPTANLDSVTGQNILDLMKELNQSEKTTFVFSTHDARVMAHASSLVPH